MIENYKGYRIYQNLRNKRWIAQPVVDPDNGTMTAELRKRLLDFIDAATEENY